MNILVTGGFGFIGGHLLKRLLEREESLVHVVDDLSTSPVPIEITIASLGNATRRLTYDLCSVAAFEPDPIIRYSQIYHLASPVGPAGVLSHGGEMVREIVDDTYKLIDLAIMHDARLLDVSSSEVYGGGQDGECGEDGPKIIPPKTTIRLEYAVAKLAMETAIINKVQVSNLDAVIVRPFNVAGPRQSGNGGFVLPRFIQQAASGAPLTVFGTGSAVRAFTHVEDVVAALLLVMNKGKRGLAYNVGNPLNRIKILELAELVHKVTDSMSEIHLVDPKQIYGDLFAEAHDKYPSAKLRLTALGWKPRFSVREIVEQTYADAVARGVIGR